MIWFFKNFYIIAVGFCILYGAASIEMRLESIEHKIDMAIAKSQQADAAIAVYAAALPASALR